MGRDSDDADELRMDFIFVLFGDLNHLKCEVYLFFCASDFSVTRRNLYF